MSDGPDHWDLASHWSQRAVAEADPVLRAAYAAAAAHFLKPEQERARRTTLLGELLARLTPRTAQEQGAAG
jgi:hypothetical protein